MFNRRDLLKYVPFAGFLPLFFQKKNGDFVQLPTNAAERPLREQIVQQLENPDNLPVLQLTNANPPQILNADEIFAGIPHEDLQASFVMRNTHAITPSEKEYLCKNYNMQRRTVYLHRHPLLDYYGEVQIIQYKTKTETEWLGLDWFSLATTEKTKVKEQQMIANRHFGPALRKA